MTDVPIVSRIANLESPSARSYTFLGTTQSLCPECLSVVPAKIIARGKRVYFRKRCPTHGLREDFVCSDVGWYDRYDYALPPKLPKQTFVEPKLGCPLDCGLCSDHEQHTCVGVLEITDNCNLRCPMCYAGSTPGKEHRTLEQCIRGIDALVRAEGKADVLQLSGGEPTTHPQLLEILDYALSQPIEYIMLNTNGIRLAKDDALLERLARDRKRIEVYLQMDGTTEETNLALRGERLLETKTTAIERIGSAGLNVTLVAAVQTDVNERELGGLLSLCAKYPFITGLSLQPATYSGRHFLPQELERRITFPDCIQLLCEQSHGTLQPDDFLPLPCAHPNCHMLALLTRHDGALVPLTRFLDAKANLDLLANGLSFTREQGERIARQYLARQNCCGPSGCGPESSSEDCSPDSSPLLSIGTVGGRTEGRDASSELSAQSFFEQAIAHQIGAQQMLRITVTSFLDVYNFDVRRVMKCCTHHVLPSGHIIPFCAYNVLYRNGHVPLPPLKSDSPR